MNQLLDVSGSFNYAPQDSGSLTNFDLISFFELDACLSLLNSETIQYSWVLSRVQFSMREVVHVSYEPG